MRDTVVNEDVVVGVESLSLNIVLDVTMRTDATNMLYTTSINELGQIILTPNNTDDEFVSAQKHEVDTTEESTQPLSEEESDNTIQKTIFMQATMLSEDNNTEYVINIDDIGQCVLTPYSDTNMFLSVTENDSLNLVTEELQSIEYFDYILTNKGDGWNIYKDSELVEEGIATLPEAKVFVCETELNKLKQESNTQTEDINKETSEDIDENDTTDVPVVRAEVINEEASDSNPVLITLSNITDNFTEDQGCISCDDGLEMEECVKILEQHYDQVCSEREDNHYIISYKNMKQISENFTDEDKQGIINRFMQGEITIVSANKDDVKHLIPLPELDADNFKYYYDSDTDVVGYVEA